MQKEVNQLIKCDICDNNAIGYYCDQNNIWKSYYCQMHEVDVFFNHLGKVDNADSDSTK